MKRILSFILCLTLVLPLLGCGTPKGNGSAAAVQAFSVGYGKADISPENPVPLSGYGDEMERISTLVTQKLYVTCTAFADTDGETLLLLAIDLGTCYDSIFPTVRERISAEVGIPVDHILFTASHSHSSPSVNSESHPNIPSYNEFFIQQSIQAAKDALADLAPAQMEQTFSRPERINCVRHYLLNDGSYLGEGVGNAENKKRVVGHTTVSDNLLQVVRFTREENKDIVMINWAGHPRNSEPYPYTGASSNYAGVLREEVERALNCHSMFILSGSGNVNNGSQIDGELAHETYEELGRLLAQEVVKAAENFTSATLENLQVTENIQTIINKGDQPIEAPLYAFSMGDFACVTAPFEIFDTNAMAVREDSQFQMTFYASCANRSLGYLPTPYAFPFNAYEARITKFPQGTAEFVLEQLTGMLKEKFAAGGYTAKEKAPGYETPAFEPWTDGETYLNPHLNDFTACTEVQNGFYQLTLVKGSTSKLYLAKDKATAEKVLSQESVKLMFDQSNVIVDIVQ